MARRARRKRQAAGDAFAHEVIVVYIASRRTYGVLCIRAELCRLGRRVYRERVARVMGERGIRGVTRRERCSLTRPDARAEPAADLIGRGFRAERPGGQAGRRHLLSAHGGRLALPGLPAGSGHP